ncbi:TRAP transporter small permease [Jeotgalicoccus sp. S0W5]|uniref:TRAP transporter small permease n=1 Tax=Jeotgalicoccus sp. S0W5 TaxID=2527874 RepID=UPI001414EADE|nr:TRAP transporter small permease subunit [Jeotgalicoccus sp. S0W5]
MNAAVLLLMFILLIVQVFFRRWLNDPLTWSEEIALLTMVWITFVGAYQCTAEDSHLKMSFLKNALPKRLSLFLNIITKIIIIIFLILAMVYGIPLLEMSISRYLPITKLSMLVPYLIIWGSIVLMLIEVALQVITELKDAIVKSNTDNESTSQGGKNE